MAEVNALIMASVERFFNTFREEKVTVDLNSIGGMEVRQMNDIGQNGNAASGDGT